MLHESALIQPVDTRMRKIYCRLWKLPTLPRIRHFIWKAIANLLSTRETLGTAIVGEDDSCPMCNLQPESSTHLIMNCSFSREVCFATLGWTSNTTGSLSEWISSWLDSLQHDTIKGSEIVNRASIVWSIWITRCNKVFQKTNTSPEVIIHQCKLLMEDHTNKTYNTPQISYRVNRRNAHWIPPPINTLTINCDGSFDSQNLSGGIGLIIRNFAIHNRKQGAST
ncbi:uncharacterized protein LOC113305367 [Papaver somniferum]|uniref:uncharacterized protein LOC113305367 n=1 Tax=Papaver somniferum TaxID=3469 RepID=UPI000E700C99|nr:uncharacterized protein LOC113305367 [Papaver somniferum]